MRNDEGPIRSGQKFASTAKLVLCVHFLCFNYNSSFYAIQCCAHRSVLNVAALKDARDLLETWAQKGVPLPHFSPARTLSRASDKYFGPSYC
jgi:hypothetical protein